MEFNIPINWRDGKGNGSAAEATEKVGGAERGVAAVSAATETAEAYNKYSEGKYYEATVSATKAAAETAKAFGNKQLSDDLSAATGYTDNLRKTYEAGSTAEKVQYGLQAGGNAVKLVNKDVGSGFENAGKTVGTYNDIQSLNETGVQIQQSTRQMTNSLNAPIRNRQLFLQFQQQYWQQMQLNQPQSGIQLSPPQ